MKKTRTEEIEEIKQFRKNLNSYHELFREIKIIQALVKECEYKLKDGAITDIYYTLDAGVLLTKHQEYFYNVIYQLALTIIDDDVYNSVYNEYNKRGV